MQPTPIHNNRIDRTILDGMKQQEQSAFRLLYTFYYPTVERFVLRNNGTKADAEDIFQETLLVLLEKVPADDFELTSSLKTYIFAVASNLWLKRLRSAKRIFRADMNDLEEELAAKGSLLYTTQSELDSETQTLKSLIQRGLAKITEHCQRLISAIFFHNKKVADLGYKNAHTAQNQQYKCLEQLRKVTDSSHKASSHKS